MRRTNGDGQATLTHKGANKPISAMKLSNSTKTMALYFCDDLRATKIIVEDVQEQTGAWDLIQLDMRD
jgi:hypothetical protein